MANLDDCLVPLRIAECDKFVDYRFTVIRKPGNYVFLDGKILTAETFVRQTGRPVDVCVPVFIRKGDQEWGHERQALFELSKLVGVKYTQLYETI